jgi:hypothetical protein
MMPRDTFTAAESMTAFNRSLLAAPSETYSQIHPSKKLDGRAPGYYFTSNGSVELYKSMGLSSGTMIVGDLENFCLTRVPGEASKEFSYSVQSRNYDRETSTFEWVCKGITVEITPGAWGERPAPPAQDLATVDWLKGYRREPAMIGYKFGGHEEDRAPPPVMEYV